MPKGAHEFRQSRHLPQGPDRLVPRATTLAVRAALLGGFAFCGTLALSLPAHAQTTAQAPASRSYSIPAGPLDRALNSFAAISGVEFTADAALLQGRSSRGLSGIFTVDQGFAELLRGQDLSAVRQGNGSYVLSRQAAPSQAATGGETTLATVKVTGTTVSATDLPASYAGGQVARGAKLGMLGNVDVMDAPFNVTAYTAQAIADQQAATVGDVLRNDPSVRFTTSDGHNAENITIRGFDVNSSELAFNGMYGMLPGAHVPTEFVERVEVFKGPAAMLSGIAPSGAVGGVVNVVTKRATEQDLTSLTTSYASLSHLSQAVDIGRRLGEEKRFGVRFNSSLGYGETSLEDQKKRDNFFALGMDYRGDRWKLEFDAYSSHQHQSNGSPLMVGFSTLGRVIDAPDPSKNALRGTYAHQRTDGAMLRGEAEITRNLTAYAALGTANYNYEGFLNGTRVVLTKAGDGNSTGQTYNQAGYTRSTSAETGLRANFGTGSVAHQMVFSLAEQRTTTGLATVNTSASYITNIYDPKVNPTIAGAHGAVARSADNVYSSVGLADTLNMFDDRVLLTGGLRSQRVRQRMASPKAYDESAITPMAGVVVKPWGPEVSLYANYIEGLSPGVTVGTTYANAGQTLEPYKTRQKEVGVKWEHGSFINTLAVFSILKPSTIETGSGTLKTLALDGKQKNEGVEWNIAGQVSRQVRMLGGLAYTRGKVVRASSAANDGKKAPGVPAWTANLGSEWDLPWVSGLTLNGRVVYTSAQYLDSANALQIPSWTRWDAGAAYAMSAFGKPVALRFAVENLTDEHYWSGRFGEGFATLGTARTFKLSASVDF